MAGSVKFDRLVAELQRTMASKTSHQERSIDHSSEDDDCHGHGCYRPDCCQGYGYHFTSGYSGDSKGQVPSEDHAELRHPHYWWWVWFRHYRKHYPSTSWDYRLRRAQHVSLQDSEVWFLPIFTADLYQSPSETCREIHCVDDKTKEGQVTKIDRKCDKILRG